MKLSPYTRKAYYYETDKMGIVHHANYIRWFEEARVDLLAQAGLPFETVEARGIMSPVLSVECEYKLPFRFNESFYIKAFIEDFGAARFSVRYEVTGDDGNVHVTGRSVHCFVDTDMRPVRLKKTHPDVYAVYDEMFRMGEALYE